MRQYKFAGRLVPRSWRLGVGTVRAKLDTARARLDTVRARLDTVRGRHMVFCISKKKGSNFFSLLRGPKTNRKNS